MVLTGAGNTFCAGADPPGRAMRQPADLGGGAKGTVHVLNAIPEHPKPVIARARSRRRWRQRAWAARPSVAVESAKFAFSEVRLGVARAVISCGVPGQDECRRRIRLLLLTGERVSAARAKESGLPNKVVDDEAPDAAVANLR